MAEKIFVGVLQNFGAVGSPFGARTAVTVGIATSVTIPTGFQYVETDAHTTVYFTPDQGTTKITVVPASSAGLIWSDGYGAVAFLGDGTGGTGHRSAVLGAG